MPVAGQHRLLCSSVTLGGPGWKRGCTRAGWCLAGSEHCLHPSPVPLLDIPLQLLCTAGSKQLALKAPKQATGARLMALLLDAARRTFATSRCSAQLRRAVRPRGRPAHHPLSTASLSSGENNLEAASGPASRAYTSISGGSCRRPWGVRALYACACACVCVVHVGSVRMPVCHISIPRWEVGVQRGSGHWTMGPPSCMRQSRKDNGAVHQAEPCSFI